MLSAGGIVIDKAAHLATVDDKPMDLSFKEFELLTYFLENQGIALSGKKSLILFGIMIISEMPEPLTHM